MDLLMGKTDYSKTFDKFREFSCLLLVDGHSVSVIKHNRSPYKKTTNNDFTADLFIF